MRRIAIIFTVLAVLTLGYLFLISKGASQAPTETRSSYLYFWSETCPHCKKVSEFLDTWPHTAQIPMDKKEVSKSRENSEVLVKEAAKCNISEEGLGVPFLVTPEGKCLEGDEPIINHFKSLYPESSGAATPSATTTP